MSTFADGFRAADRFITEVLGVVTHHEAPDGVCPGSPHSLALGLCRSGRPPRTAPGRREAHLQRLQGAVMSMPTAIAGDFDDFEFALIVADFKPDPDPEPEPEPEPDGPTTPSPVRRGRPSRQIADRNAIHQSLGIRRHRTGEREA